MVKKNKFLILRAHHLLCLQGFQGYGYDEPFTKNLSKIHKIFLKSKKLKLIFSNDLICKHCPFSTKANTKCFKKNSNVKYFDLKVIKILSLKPQTILSLSKVLQKVELKRRKLITLCKNCEWKSICLWFIKGTPSNAHSKI